MRMFALTVMMVVMVMVLLVHLHLLLRIDSGGRVHAAGLAGVQFDVLVRLHGAELLLEWRS